MSGTTQPLSPPRQEPLPGAVAKPAWQVSLDSALLRVGHFIEDAIKRFRAAPQSTQLAISIAALGAALLFLSLLLLLIMH